MVHSIIIDTASMCSRHLNKHFICLRRGLSWRGYLYKLLDQRPQAKNVIIIGVVWGLLHSSMLLLNHHYIKIYNTILVIYSLNCFLHKRQCLHTFFPSSQTQQTAYCLYHHFLEHSDRGISKTGISKRESSNNPIIISGPTASYRLHINDNNYSIS